jgi:hypothetical protein
MTAGMNDSFPENAQTAPDKMTLGRLVVRMKHEAWRWTAPQCLGLSLIAVVCFCRGINAGAATEVLDTVVASVGNVAITSSDVAKEYRFERFLDGEWPAPPPDAAALNDVRQRLVYQALLAEEENPDPDERAESGKAAAERLQAVRKQFAHPEDYSAALSALGMTESEVLARIVQQDLLLRLISERLRPEASPTDDDVANYYRSIFIPQFQKQNTGVAAPALSDVSDQIREVLIQKRINALLEEWIEELGPTRQVKVHTF